MRQEIIEPIEETIREREESGEDMSDIRAFLEEMYKIGCINCQWYKDGECLYYDRKVEADYFCRMWG